MQPDTNANQAKSVQQNTLAFFVVVVENAL